MGGKGTIGLDRAYRRYVCQCYLGLQLLSSSLTTTPTAEKFSDVFSLAASEITVLCLHVWRWVVGWVTMSEQHGAIFGMLRLFFDFLFSAMNTDH
jgi:hypothetical protein